MKRFLTSSLWTWVVILLALLCLLAGHQQIRTVQVHQERLEQCTNLARAFHGLEDGLWNLEEIVALRKTDSSMEVQQRMIQELVRLKKAVERTREMPALLTENQGAMIRLETILILLERNLSLETLDLPEAEVNLRRARQETRSASARLWQQYRDVAGEITGRWLEVNLLVLVSCLLAAFLAFLLRSYHRDLMDRREAERALRESEDRYRRLVEVCPDAILVERGGKILFVNSTAVRMFGAESARGMLGRDLAELQEERGGQLRGRTRMRRLSGEVFDAEVVATDFAYQDSPAVQMVIRDTTALRLQTAALEASERRYRSLFENVSEGVYRSSPEGRILEANPALVRLLGYGSIDELKTALIDRDLYADPADREAALEILHREGKLEGFELRLRRRDGAEVTVIENSRIVWGADGEIECYEGTLTDISDRKLAEQALVAARDEALHVSRLKSEFLANVSHEIRTPMNGILGMSELLRGTALSDEQKEFTEAVSRSAEYLMNIINDVLDFSKIEAGKIEFEEIEFNLRTAVEDVMELLAESAQEKQLEFGAFFEPGLPATHWGDPQRFQQVLTNLVGNAIKFTAEGEVLVEVSVASGGCVRVEVRDTGIGVAPELHSRLFQPFTQGDGSTTRRFGGTGLGLAISRQLVERLGGRIGVAPRPGRGSCFWFDLPLKAGRPQEARPAAVVGSALIGLPAGPLRRMVEQTLAQMGWEIRAAGDIQEFLLLAGDAAQQGKPFDACLVHDQWIGGADLQAVPQLVRFVRIRERNHARPGGVILSEPCRQTALIEAIEGLAGRRAEASSLRELNERLATEAMRPTRLAERILVAEDNAINQRVALRMLEKLGLSADIAANGAEAVKAIQTNPYPVILMDCQMPEMDGFQATAAIRAWEAERGLPRTPIIAMTAHAMTGDRERCLEAGMDDYLAKPISIRTLNEVLSQFVETRRQGERQLMSVNGD
jgi:PAS domain S-box-containing protein